jgi:hypothetical protein
MMVQSLQKRREKLLEPYPNLPKTSGLLISTLFLFHQLDTTKLNLSEMRELLLDVCEWSEDESSFYSLPMTVVAVGMVGNTLQESLGSHLSHLGEPWIKRSCGGFGRTMGWADLAQFRQAASSFALIRRLVNFGPIHRVNSEFLAHSYISLVFDIVRLIYRLS